MTSSDALPGPVRYPRVRASATVHTRLLLRDLVVLRRVRGRQSLVQIARELNANYSSIRNRMYYLRGRFDVHSTWELAHHPIVAAQLEENE